MTFQTIHFTIKGENTHNLIENGYTILIYDIIMPICDTLSVHSYLWTNNAFITDHH
jgi:hypothetical protein